MENSSEQSVKFDKMVALDSSPTDGSVSRVRIIGAIIYHTYNGWPVTHDLIEWVKTRHTILKLGPFAQI